MLTPPRDEWVPPPPAVLARNAIVGLLAVMGLVALLGLTLRGPIELVSAWFVDQLGTVGVFVAILLIDTLPVGSHDPVLFAGTSGGLPFPQLCFAAMSASILATWLDWWLGRAIGSRTVLITRLAERYRIRAWLDRYGAWAVAIAALLPLPYSLVAWSAGMTGGPFAPVAVGSVLRATKVLVVLSLIKLGWQISA